MIACPSSFIVCQPASPRVLSNSLVDNNMQTYPGNHLKKLCFSKSAYWLSDNCSLIGRLFGFCFLIQRNRHEVKAVRRLSD